MRSNILIKWGGYGLLLASLLLACGPKKRVVSSGGSETRISGTAKRAVVNQVQQQQQRYTTFSGRARSNVTINGKERYDLTANVRIVHDEAIWISVTAIMGIEVARVFITPDSIKVINRLASEYIGKPFAYLRNFTGSGLDFASLEQLLVGNVVDQIAGDDLEVWQGVSGYLLQRQAADLQYAARVGNDYQNRYTLIADSAHGQQLEAHYSGHRTAAGNAFPNQMEISIATPHLALQAAMVYNKFVYDEKVELPFSVPSRYTEIQ